MSASRWDFTTEYLNYLVDNQSGNPDDEAQFLLPRVLDVVFKARETTERLTVVVVSDHTDRLVVMLPAVPFIEAAGDFVVMVAEAADYPPVMQIYKSAIQFTTAPCREVRSAYLRLLLGTPGALESLCAYAYRDLLSDEDHVSIRDLKIVLEKEICWLETRPEAFDEEGLASIRKRLPIGNNSGPPRKIH